METTTLNRNYFLDYKLIEINFNRTETKPSLSERKRLAGEIIPKTAHQSRTYDGRVASNVIDLKVETTSRTVGDPNPNLCWIELLFDKVRLRTGILVSLSSGSLYDTYSGLNI